MYNLFLDDIRSPADVANYILPVALREYFRKYEWIIARNYKEFITIINEKGIPNVVSFDHDLSDIHYSLVDQTDCLSWNEYYLQQDREMTGYDCAKWLLDFCMENKVHRPKMMLVHSMNPVGKENIFNLLKNYGEWENN